MTTLTDARLSEAGLGADGIRGFRAAMRHRPSRNPDLILPEDHLLEGGREDRALEFRRGVLVAQAWWAMRTAKRVQQRKDGDAIEQRGAAGRSDPLRQLVVACAAVDGFVRPDPVVAWRIANQVQPGDAGYIEKDVVTFFHADGPNGVLSPTHPTLIVHDGEEWRSVEALYQAQKHSDRAFRRNIRLAPDALSAKALARSREGDLLPMRGHFKPGRRLAMTRGHMLRAQQDAAFRAALHDTGRRDIVEHTTGDGLDTRWGVVGSASLRGWNLQGRILKAVREACVRDEIPFLGASS